MRQIWQRRHAMMASLEKRNVDIWQAKQLWLKADVKLFVDGVEFTGLQPVGREQLGIVGGLVPQNRLKRVEVRYPENALQDRAQSLAVDGLEDELMRRERAVVHRLIMPMDTLRRALRFLANFQRCGASDVRLGIERHSSGTILRLCAKNASMPMD